MRDRVTLRELSDSNNHLSTTRYIFCLVVEWAIALIVLTIISWLFFRYIGKETDGLFSGVSALLGILVSLATGAKILQGFENGHESNNTDEIIQNTTKSVNNAIENISKTDKEKENYNIAKEDKNENNNFVQKEKFDKSEIIREKSKNENVEDDEYEKISPEK